MSSFASRGQKNNIPGDFTSDEDDREDSDEDNREDNDEYNSGKTSYFKGKGGKKPVSYHSQGHRRRHHPSTD
jgi:hypothetical protein